MKSKVTVVLVHGWAMNSAVWNKCVSFFPEWIEVVLMDLPGYGVNSKETAKSLDDYVDFLVAKVTTPVLWVGWSLGGLVLLQLAQRYPQCVSRLFIVASNPCFVNRDDWQHGVDKEVFRQFSHSLNNDLDATIKRFLALQVKGSQGSMSVVRELQNSQKLRGQATIEVLELGLQVLECCDFREILKDLDCPVTWWLGGKDKLVPEQVAKEITYLNPSVNVSIEKEAAHAPFISHPENFMSKLIEVAEQL